MGSFSLEDSMGRMLRTILTRTRLRYRSQLRYVLILLILILALLIQLILPQPASSLLGIYDPTKMFNHPSVAIEHHFVPWRLNDTEELKKALAQAQAHGRTALITLEPWPWNWQGMDRETLLQDVVAGRYDQTIDRSLQTIQAQSPRKVMLRWGHEMEIVGQYPWSVADSGRYIEAYRHVVGRSRQLGITNILWVWSPAGNRNAASYWPGEDVVDLVGLSIYATPEWHPQKSNQLPSFKLLLQEKYWLVKKWHKPAILAEVGVNASPEQQERWLRDAMNQLGGFPGIVGWVYFNQIQPTIVPLSIGQPDWSLKPRQVQFIEKHWPVMPDAARYQEIERRLSPKG
jgi:beta-mannanase